MIIHKEDLAAKLINVYNFGYTTKNKMKNNDIVSLFSQELKENVFDRIGVLYNLTKFAIIEENYVETEWKEMIAKHYIHSAYSSTLRQRVIRIHLLSEDEFSEENYLGFITLRPLEEITIALSFVYVNWKHKIFSNDISYVMTYPKEVHYMGKSIVIHTYPFFAQDSIVTCCADANVIMLSKYFLNKFNSISTEKLSLIFEKQSTQHQLPKKVDSALLRRMLSDSGISYRIERYHDIEKMENSEWLRVQKNIDAYIESGLPVILGIDGHVVQLIGHIDSNNGLDRKYIVYDDSGHLEKLCLENQQIKHKFSYMLSINDIKNYISKTQISQNEDKVNSFFLLMSEHEKVFIDFNRYQVFLSENLIQYADLDKNSNSLFSHIFDNNSKVKSSVSFRNMLIDNSLIKEFLLRQEIPEQSETINKILNKELPHYLWYTEISMGNKAVCLCADPTMYYDTRDIEKLFLYTEPIGIIDGTSLSLLTKGE